MMHLFMGFDGTLLGMLVWCVSNFRALLLYNLLFNNQSDPEPYSLLASLALDSIGSSF